MDKVKTLVIDNFGGRMTRINNGDINSGLTKIAQTFGNDPFTKPNQLTWEETYAQIDAAGAVITGLIMCGKPRVESGITYVYMVDHTGRVYKIQVNDPTTYNPDYDNPVLLTTITSGTPTFTRGGFIDFFGATERIFIGHDKGVTRLDFDGTNETVVGVVGSWTQTVPRPLKQFLGNLYVGNGSNIAEIISAATVSTYTKLSPGFPTNAQVRDLDVSIDGNYLQAVVTRQILGDLTSVDPDIGVIGSTDSFIFKWNGIDTGYTASVSYPSFALSANINFENYQYVFGSDLVGGALYNPDQKILSSTFEQSPLPNAVDSQSNFLAWMSTFQFEGKLDLCLSLFGPLDREVGTGLWSPLSQTATAPETDIVRIPYAQIISNLSIGPSTTGYLGEVFGLAKAYYSTLETSSTTTKYRFFKWYCQSTGLHSSLEGVYETQNQLFSKRIKIAQVRVYGEPWVPGNSFQIDLIGSNLGVISNSTGTFTVGNNVTSGQDMVVYNPGIAPLYSLGVRVTNLGVVNHTINKIEIDYSHGGE